MKTSSSFPRRAAGRQDQQDGTSRRATEWKQPVPMGKLVSLGRQPSHGWGSASRAGQGAHTGQCHAHTHGPVPLQDGFAACEAAL